MDCAKIKRKDIVVLTSRYPSSYQPNNYIFVKEQVETLAEEHNILVVGCIPVSLKYFFLKKPTLFEMKGDRDDKVRSLFVYFPSIPKIHWINEKIRTAVNKIIIRRILRRQTVDIFHFHSVWAASIGEWLVKKQKRKYIITEHSSAFLSPLNRLNTRIAKKAFQFSSINIAVSQTLADKIKIQLDIVCVVIPNMVDSAFFSPRFIESKKSERKILTIGNLVDVKNHRGLLNAFYSFSKNSRDNIKLDIIGEGPNRDILLKDIKKLGLDNRVRLLGYKNRGEIREHLDNADYFVMTSIHETFGVAVIEALVMGLPLLCTEFGGVSSDLMGKPGCVIVKNNEESLVEGFKKLMCLRKSEEIREYVVANYSHREVANRLTNLYESEVLANE